MHDSRALLHDQEAAIAIEEDTPWSFEPLHDQLCLPSVRDGGSCVGRLEAGGGAFLGEGCGKEA